jgi:hypothetical protein
MIWGIVVGLLQAAPPLAFWWLDSATVYVLARRDRLQVVVPALLDLKVRHAPTVLGRPVL